jgi:tRNA pseudouridine38-40 synthase
MERNIKLILEYEGTNYHGWQIQENSITVQQKVEEAIFQLTGERIRVTGAGRTDAGVHARGQVANFFLTKGLLVRKIEGGINAYLPKDIVVRSAEVVEKDFNARFKATKRVYQYYICFQRTALMRNFCWQIFQELNQDVLEEMNEMVRGEHDFSSFARLETQTDHKRCTVYESVWQRWNDQLIYRIVANRFLHGMVRTLVGTMVDVASGKYSIEEFKKIFQAKNRLEAGAAAPAKGLILEEVIY